MNKVLVFFETPKQVKLGEAKEASKSTCPGV